jgi:predicted outer membrane protein
MKRFLLGLVLLGCAAETTQEPPPVTTTAATIGAAVVARPTSDDAFSDDEILGLAATLNTNVMDAAVLAASRATDDRVKELARSLIADHTQARDVEAQLAERLSMRVEATELMTAMRSAGRADAQKLATLSGRAFDDAFVADQNADQIHRRSTQIVDVQRLAEDSRRTKLSGSIANLIGDEGCDHDDGRGPAGGWAALRALLTSLVRGSPQLSEI